MLCWYLFCLCCSYGAFASEESIPLESLLERARLEDIIDSQQLARLLALAGDLGVGGASSRLMAAEQPELEEEQALPGRVAGSFVGLYNQLTLLNILYFSGALLVMGAYTLFMTLAWERFDSGRMAVLMCVQVAIFGAVGVSLWNSGEYQFVGGLLCVISEAMVPYTVYNIQRVLNLWPGGSDPSVFQDFRNYVRGGWVAMEISTIVTGLAFLILVPFPFLVFPLSFSLWFLSMDLAPLLYLWTSSYWELRRQLSLLFGAGMICAGIILEQQIGSDPDFSFWLHLFGLIAFWFSLTFDFPVNDLYGSVYLLINVCLGLIGGRLERMTFHVFATLGISLYCYGVLSNHIKKAGSVGLWVLKAVGAVALFSQAIRRGSDIEILWALVCIAVFNYDALFFILSSEPHCLFMLITNVGFIAASSAFQRPISLWFFTIPCEQFDVVGGLCCLSVVTFHISTLAKTANGFMEGIFLLYKTVASVLVSLVLVCLHHPEMAWLGGLGLPAVAMALNKSWRQQRSTFICPLSSWVVLLLGICFSNVLQSNLLYLLCCVHLSFLMQQIFIYWKKCFCVLCVVLILLSVPFHSKFIIVIGVVGMFTYLSYLAYDVFKNSFFFPLAVIGIGLALLYCGSVYQRLEPHLIQTMDNLLSNAAETFLVVKELNVCEPNWIKALEATDYSSLSLGWVLWSGALVFALAKSSFPLVPCLCVGGIFTLIAVMLLSTLREKMKEDLRGVVKVTNLSTALDKQGYGGCHGIVIKINGTKPSSLKEPATVALDVSGDEFWNHATRVFGGWVVNLARSMFLPYKLTPHLITFSGFKAGRSVWSATIRLGGGHGGSHRAKHSTFTSKLSQLGKGHLTCTLLYSAAWYKPYSQLCDKEVLLSNVATHLRSS